MQVVKKLVIVAILGIFISSPRIVFGFRNERLAQAAVHRDDYARAAEEFTLAAHRLFFRADLWNDVGKFNLLLGEKEKAVIAYNAAKEKKRLSAFGWYFLGTELWGDGYHEDALALWQEGLASYPTYFEFYSRLAMAYREKGNYSLERDALENRLRFDGNAEDIAYSNYRLGMLLMLDESESALDELRLAANMDDGFAPAVETLRVSLNLALLENDPVESIILLGRGLALVEEWQLAAVVFYNATQAQPESASAWAWLGEAKQHLNQNALPDLDKALDLAPDSVLVRSLRGLYWQRLGNLDNAVNEFLIASALEPENPYWHTALGDAYARSGDSLLALAAYEQATSLSPNDPFYWNLLALFSANYAMNPEEIGLFAAEQAISLRPEEVAFIDTLGWVYFILGKDEKAEEEFMRAIDLNPNFGAAHLHLGMLYLKRNHPSLAYESLLRARNLSDDAIVDEQATRLLDEYFQE